MAVCVISDYGTFGGVEVTVVVYSVVGAVRWVGRLVRLKPDEWHGLPGETLASQRMTRFSMAVAVARGADWAPDILS